MIECGCCRIRNSHDLFFCQACGTRLVSTELLPEAVKDAGIAELRSVVERLVAARIAEAEPALSSCLATVSRQAVVRRGVTRALVPINFDGSDGHACALGAEAMDIGRTSGNLLFDDPHLASRHARIVPAADGYLLTALETRNGVYRRLRGPAEIVGGDKILIGRQVLRFEVVPEREGAAPAAFENGTAIFGSRVRPAWGRLLQLTSAGIACDVHHLGRGEIIVGRGKADVVFSDDDVVSARHARLSLRDGRTLLEDLSSTNGTFLGVREPYLLVPGDVIRMGNQVLRFD
jgi:pSer/pThr/pTyr-binding forkhead associated (FHA) protein